MFAKLHIQPACSSHDKPKSVDLKISSNPLLFGWNETCGIRILRKQVAGEHASINRDKDGKVWLINLDSEHHTMLNGEDVKEPMLLKDNDLISIAGRQFVYEEVKEDEQSVSATDAAFGKHVQVPQPQLNHSMRQPSFEGIGEVDTNLAQNSITNPSRDKPTGKRCTNIQLSVQRKVDFGYGVWILGSTPFLGEWNVSKAQRMQWTEGDNWVITLEDREDPFPNEFEYKYLIRHEDESDGGNFEDGSNRKLVIEVGDEVNTPFYIMRVKDNWDSKEVIEKKVEGYMQEGIGYTIGELSLYH